MPRQFAMILSRRRTATTMHFHIHRADPVSGMDPCHQVLSKTEVASLTLAYQLLELKMMVKIKIWKVAKVL